MKYLAAIFSVFFPLYVNASLITTEHLINGDFETGTFAGWTVVNTGSGAWNINNGAFDPAGPGTPLAPIGGAFDAVSSQGGPGLHNLYQTVALPSSFSLAVLSWSDRIRSNVGFSDPSQEWRVLIQDSSGNLLFEVFSTNPGDPTQQIGPNNRSFDLTGLLAPFSGQNVRVSFEQQDTFGFFNATLDNASFRTSVRVPEPAVIGALGLALLAMRRLRKR